jgi:hypothetical protein
MRMPIWLGRWELAILALSLVLRLALIHPVTWEPIHDTRDYHVLAWSLSHGQGYRQVYDGETVEYRGLTFRAYRMPGYPVFLALLYSTVGWRPYHAYLANVGLELLTELGVLFAGHRLFGRPTALAAQALFGLHVLWTPILMTESLFTALYGGLALLCLVAPPGGGVGPAAAFGLVLAAATFVRPIALSVLPVALAPRIAGRPLRRAVGLGLLVVTPTAIAMTAWAVRNARVVGQPVPLSTNLGPHNARAFGIDRTAVVLGLRARGVSGEAEINRVLLGQIADAVRRAPGWAAGLYLRRLAEVLTPRRSRGVVERYAGGALLTPLYRGLALQYFVTYPLALGGLVVLARRGQPVGTGAGLLASFVLLHALVSNGSLRFAAPLYPLLCLPAGWALVHLAGRLGSAALRPAPR